MPADSDSSLPLSVLTALNRLGARFSENDIRAAGYDFASWERGFADAVDAARAALLHSLREMAADTARIEWIRENATTVSDGYGPNGELAPPFHLSTHGRVMLLETTLPTVPRESKDWTRAAIDAARTPQPETRP
jgi:hypothetical protein